MHALCTYQKRLILYPGINCSLLERNISVLSLKCLIRTKPAIWNRLILYPMVFKYNKAGQHYSPSYTPFIQLYSTVYSVQCTVYSVQCTPSRETLPTGLFPIHTGTVHFTVYSVLLFQMVCLWYNKKMLLFFSFWDFYKLINI